jgi:hypothetical protein
MIRVQYKDQLSHGLNGKAERSGRGTTVYLVPGLTGGQRRAALRRLRQEASRGCGPALPGADLTVALAADRFRAGLRNTAAVVRQHPAGSLLPTALAGLLMTLFVLASVSARMSQVPSAAMPGGPALVNAQPTVIGYPTLAQENAAVAPGAHKAAVGSAVQPNPSWSLAASSGTTAAGHAQGSHRAQSSGTGKVCGPAGDRAGDGERAPGTGQDASCKAKSTRLPWPPPPGGWPRFWWPEQAATPGGTSTGVALAPVERS